MYTVEHLTMQQIADRIGYSKGHVGQQLNAAGIDAKQGTWVDLECAKCGSRFKEERAKARRPSKHYCTDACYFAARATTDYRENRQGQRNARKVVSKYFALALGYVVHHERMGITSITTSVICGFSLHSQTT